MITILNIIDAINDLLLTKYPEYTHYIEEIPQGFERPSFYIQAVTDSWQDANRATTIENPSFQVVYFANVDAHNLSSVSERLGVYSAVKNLFKPGYVMTEGKAIKLAENGFKGEIRDNEVFFTLDFEYFEDRPRNEVDYPLAAEVKVNIKEV